jgi:uncharacterized membrane protein SpoIIM required for sporulation
MDKWIGALFLVIVLAFVAIGSMTAYSMYGTNPQSSDTYGNAFSNKTNSTVKVETAVAPVSINIMGYITLLAVIFVVIGAGVAVFKAVSSKSGSGSLR